VLYINGEWRNSPSDDTFNVYNPGNGEIVDSFAEGNAHDTTEAVKAAEAAFSACTILNVRQKIVTHTSKYC
jgi:acyl-CoA reductase-like NAD-dependent aldehyde dehydrogenase